MKHRETVVGVCAVVLPFVGVAIGCGGATPPTATAGGAGTSAATAPSMQAAPVAKGAEAAPAGGASDSAGGGHLESAMAGAASPGARPLRMLTCTQATLQASHGSSQTTWRAVASPSAAGGDVGTFTPATGATVTYHAPMHAALGETITITAQTPPGSESFDVPVATAFPVTRPTYVPPSGAGAPKIDQIPYASPKTAVAAGADQYVVWADRTSSSTPRTLRFAHATFGGAWSAPVVLTDQGDPHQPTVAVDRVDAGVVYVAFEQGRGGVAEITIRDANTNAPKVSAVHYVATYTASTNPVVASPQAGVVAIATVVGNSVAILRDVQHGDGFSTSSGSVMALGNNPASGALTCDHPSPTCGGTWEVIAFPRKKSAPAGDVCAVPIAKCDASKCDADHGLCVPKQAAPGPGGLLGKGQEAVDLVSGPAFGVSTRLCFSWLMQGSTTTNVDDVRVVVSCSDALGAPGSWSAPEATNPPGTTSGYQVVAWNRRGEPAIADPTLAVSANGAIAAAWARGSKEIHVGWYGGGQFDDTLLPSVSTTPGSGFARPDVVFAGDGSLWVAYEAESRMWIDRACGSFGQGWSGPVPVTPASEVPGESNLSLLMGFVSSGGASAAFPAVVAYAGGSTLAYHPFTQP